MDPVIDKIIKYLETKNVPDHYILIQSDNMWGHNGGYLPIVYTFDAYKHEIPRILAKIVYGNYSNDDRLQSYIDDKIHCSILHTVADSYYYATDETELSQDFIDFIGEGNRPNVFEYDDAKQFKVLFDQEMFIKMISTKTVCDALLEKLKNGISVGCGELRLIKDNDGVWDELVGLHIPIDSDMYFVINP